MPKIRCMEVRCFGHPSIVMRFPSGYEKAAITIGISTAARFSVLFSLKCALCIRKIPLRIRQDMARFLNGIRLPDRGVKSTPATIVICQVDAISHDSPYVEASDSGA